MIVIVPEQIRAGRALLGWSIADLSDASGVSVTAIQRMEKARGECDVTNALASVVSTLRENGVHMVKDLGRFGATIEKRKV